jgi:hypothetical protein
MVADCLNPKNLDSVNASEAVAAYFLTFRIQPLLLNVVEQQP